jgi:protein-S-isoprenylcysteine O-methyltransferase Ste14
MTTLDLLRLTSLALWFVWILVYWWGGIYIVLTILQSIEEANTPLDTVLLLVILVLAQPFIGTGATVIMGMVRVMQWADNIAVAAIGLLLVVIGAVGSTTCRYAMGRLWSAATVVQGEHAILDRGLWGLVRHPLYAFIFVMYMGTAVVFATWWEWVLLALMITAHIKKLTDEERFLETSLPGYRDYQQRVRYRIIPGVW